MKIGIIASREDYDSEKAVMYTTSAMSYYGASLGHDVYLFTMDDVMRGVGHRSHGGRVVRRDSLEDHVMDVKRGLSTGFVDMSDMDAIFLRSNPPKNARGMELMVRMWDYLAKMKGPLMINNPARLKEFSDKRSLIGLPYTPDTEVYTDVGELLRDVSFRDRCVIKPAFGTYGGDGVYLMKPSVKIDAEKMARIKRDVGEYLDNGGVYLLQEFVDDKGDGDKRLIVFDGKILGDRTVTRLAGSNGLHNTAQGGEPISAPVTEHDEKLVRALYPFYREAGMLFVGFDIVGGHCMEGNIVSPGGTGPINMYSLEENPGFVPVEKQIMYGLARLVG
jgi:glutathione synthase